MRVTVWSTAATAGRGRRVRWIGLGSGGYAPLLGLLRRSAFLLDDVEREAVEQLHAGRAENGAHGSGRSALFSDHLADVAGVDAETKNGRVGLGDCLNGSPSRMVYQCLCHSGYELFDLA